MDNLKPRGLYGKYIIYKSTGEPLDGPAFVLRYDRDPAAAAALAYYADQVEASNATLAADLRAMLAAVQRTEVNTMTKYLLIEERDNSVRLISERLLYTAALAEMEFEAVECREVELLAPPVVQREPWCEKHRTTDDLLRYHIYEVDADRQIDEDDIYEIVTFGKLSEPGENPDE